MSTELLPILENFSNQTAREYVVRAKRNGLWVKTAPIVELSVPIQLCGESL